MRQMFDAAYLPADPAAVAGFAIAAGYLQSPNAAHAWPLEDWTRLVATFPHVTHALPIFVYGAANNPDPAAAARSALMQTARIAQHVGHPFPLGASLALDVEAGDAQHAHDTGFVRGWAATIVGMGYAPLLYTSESYVHLFGDVPALRVWGAEWTGRAHLVPGNDATQWTAGAAFDSSIVDDDLPLWTVKGAPPVQAPPAPAAHHLAAPIVAFVPTPSNEGYWLVGADGGVFAFGDAHFHDSVASDHLGAAISSAACTSDGAGLWLCGEDGGVYALGHAQFKGSIPGLHVQPAPGTEPDPTP